GSRALAERSFVTRGERRPDRPASSWVGGPSLRAKRVSRSHRNRGADHVLGETAGRSTPSTVLELAIRLSSRVEVPCSPKHNDPSRCVGRDFPSLGYDSDAAEVDPPSHASAIVTETVPL